MKKLFFIIACLSSSASAAWYEGQWTCNLDGRLTEMRWKWYEAGYSTKNSDGTMSSSEHGNWKLDGRFKDVGRGWVKLTRTNDSIMSPIYAGYGQLSSGNTLYFIYGGDNTLWKLVYNPGTGKAEGNSTWRGKKYPLSCEKAVG